jgi:hypothetical protein
VEEEREVVLNIKESSKLNQRQRQRQVNLSSKPAWSIERGPGQSGLH